MKKIMLVGSTGFIAAKMIPWLKYKGYSLVCVSKAFDPEIIYLDLSNCHEFDFSILNKVDIVIFTAAISSLDFCETKFEESYAINVIGTKRFITEAITRGCRVLFFSSDAVYGLDKREAFQEDSFCEPISNYGKMKREVELSFCQESKFKAIRLSYVFSLDDKFTKYYLSCINQGIKAEVFHPFYRNVIFIEDLFILIESIINKWDEISSFVINASSNELISRVKIADCIDRSLGQPMGYSIIPIPEEMKLIRPSITQMRSKYISQLVGQEFSKFDEKVFQEIQRYIQK